MNPAPKNNDQGKVVGARVRRIAGRTHGQEGVIVAIHGSIAGDTLITMRLDDGTEIKPYLRQVAVV